MKGHRFSDLFFLFLLVFLTGCVSRAQDTGLFLCLADAKTKRLIWSTEVNKDDRFVLEYTHSVHGTPVSDHYVIGENNRIILFKTAFSAFGAGMPYETAGYKVSIENGVYVISQLNLIFEQVLLRVVSIAEHRIIIHDDTVFMNDLVSQGTLLAIYVR